MKYPMKDFYLDKDLPLGERWDAGCRSVCVCCATGRALRGEGLVLNRSIEAGSATAPLKLRVVPRPCSGPAPRYAWREMTGVRGKNGPYLGLGHKDKHHEFLPPHVVEHDLALREEER